MKILMIIRWLHYSGAPKMFTWIANVLAEKGYDVTVFTFGDDKENRLSDKVHFIHHDLQNVGFFKIIKTIRSVINQISPDVSISFLLDSNVYNTIACLGIKTKSVICERNDPYKPHYYKLQIFKPLFRLSDGGIFQLEKVRDYYSCIRKNSAVIPNPVMLSSEILVHPFLQRKNVVVSVGRLDVFQKRQDLLIKAFAKFHRQFENYHLEIYGDGPDRVFLEKIVTQEKVEKYVEFKGVTQNPLEIISSSKFYVLSSDFEGIPNSLIEAMSIGIPCISTDCRPGGAAFLIKDSVNGLLVKCNNVEALCNAMCYMASHPLESDRMGINAKKVNTLYSEEKIAQMWFDYLNRIIGYQ